jgi:hypothetical protein
VLKNFEVSKNCSETWPLSTGHICKFIEWAFYEKGLKFTTIRSYVSNLATLHKIQDLQVNNFQNFLVKTSLRGVENLSFNIKSKINKRKAMTLPLLRILGHEVAKKDWPDSSKSVIWTAMCTAFFGSFRTGEILAKEELAFSRAETLVWADVKFLKDGSIQILNKIPKNRTPGGETIDLFEFDDTCCPVTAMKKLRDSIPHTQNSPVFRFASGKLLTQKTFNNIIVECLEPKFGAKAKHFSGHSFRAGLPSALASCQDLASEKAIKKWGRWSSSAFEKYTRLNHQAKRDVFALFSEALAKEKFNR